MRVGIELVSVIKLGAVINPATERGKGTERAEVEKSAHDSGTASVAGTVDRYKMQIWAKTYAGQSRSQRFYQSLSQTLEQRLSQGL